MPIDPADYFDLSADDLREVARYAVDSAEDVLPVFEQVHPADGRPRAAVDAAWTFVNGAGRTKLQRAAAVDAHRAAKVAGTAAAQHAASAAGDPDVGLRRVQEAAERATPALVDVLRRYPPAPTGKSRVSILYSTGLGIDHVVGGVRAGGVIRQSPSRSSRHQGHPAESTASTRCSRRHSWTPNRRRNRPSRVPKYAAASETGMTSGRCRA